MQIEIHIPRPMITLLTVAAISGWAVALWPSGGHPASASVLTAQVVEQNAPADTGGSVAATVVQQQQSSSSADQSSQGNQVDPAVQKRTDAEEKARQIREEQDALNAKEDILRSQLEALDREREATPKTDPNLEKQFRTSTLMLVDLMKDSKAAEDFLLSTMNEIWEAEGRATAIATGAPNQNIGNDLLQWPVQPLQGISAYFHDQSYEQRFKMQHNAIDIPTPQGTIVFAAAGGIVTDVVDHGLGFNYITIAHPGGYSTLYGHINQFSVQKGQHVIAGDPIGYSGGRPGTKGAGISTGPHLHFGVYMNGAPVDPLKYLPAEAGVKVPD